MTAEARPLNGLFRGMCVDNKDPKNLGRIRVQVPQILGTATSGWAFPAWGIHATTVWPVDRLPKPGDGVWVMFDSTSPDKMIWIAAFGALDLINQAGFVENPEFTSTLSISASPSTPVWNEILTFTGFLWSDGGLPNPTPIIRLQAKPAGGEWGEVDRATHVDINTGRWSIPYRISLVGPVEYRAYFGGTSVYSEVTSAVIATDTTTSTTLTLSVGGTPVWQKSSTFSGVLDSGTGIPTPSPEVSLQAKPTGGEWRTVGTSSVDPSTGAWSVSHTITDPGEVSYLASFSGVGVFEAATSPAISVDTTTATSLTLSVDSIVWNQTATFSGVLSSPLGVPQPGALIELQKKPSASTNWSVVATASLTDLNTGAWSIPYLIASTGGTDYRASFSGVGSFLSSTSSTISSSPAAPTSTSAPSLTTLYNGTAFSTSGSVTSASGTPTGTAELWWRHTVGGDTSWKLAIPAVSLVSGTYSFTHPALTVIGDTEWQVRYVASGSFLDSTSSSVAAIVGLRGNNTLTKGTVTHTSAAFSWTATVGATHYNVQRAINGGSWAAYLTQTASKSVSNTGLSNSTTYAYRVQPTTQDPAGTWYVGAWSPTITMNTGRPSVTDSGETGWITVTVQSDASHRLDTGWGYVSDMRQGYYDTAYGGEGYTGIAKYTGTRVRDAIIAACGGGTTGSTRQSKGTCSAAEISLKRGNASGIGAGAGPVSISFRTTTSTGTGGAPVRDGSSKTLDSTNANASSFSWHDIGTAHGQRIGDAGANSICINRNSRANYAQFDAGSLRLKWAWDYTSVTYVAPSWS